MEEPVEETQTSFFTDRYVFQFPIRVFFLWLRENICATWHQNQLLYLSPLSVIFVYWFLSNSAGPYYLSTLFNRYQSMRFHQLPHVASLPPPSSGKRNSYTHINHTVITMEKKNNYYCRNFVFSIKIQPKTKTNWIILQQQQFWVEPSDYYSYRYDCLPG